MFAGCQHEHILTLAERMFPYGKVYNRTVIDKVAVAFHSLTLAETRT